MNRSIAPHLALLILLQAGVVWGQEPTERRRLSYNGTTVSVEVGEQLERRENDSGIDWTYRTPRSKQVIVASKHEGADRLSSERVQTLLDKAVRKLAASVGRETMFRVNREGISTGRLCSQRWKRRESSRYELSSSKVQCGSSIGPERTCLKCRCVWGKVSSPDASLPRFSSDSRAVRREIIPRQLSECQ